MIEDKMEIVRLHMRDNYDVAPWEWDNGELELAIYDLITKNQAKNNEVLDPVSKRELLNELINNQEEIISSPIRFNGVSIEKLKQIFEKNGVKYETPF